MMARSSIEVALVVNGEKHSSFPAPGEPSALVLESWAQKSDCEISPGERAIRSISIERGTLGFPTMFVKNREKRSLSRCSF